MVEVSYYIGLGRKMVLCISDIPYPTSPEGAVTVEGMKVLYSYRSIVVQSAHTPVTRFFNNNLL